MSQRISRINELLQREVSEQMRRYYRSETAAITISDVDCSTDLRHAKIFFSVLGDDAAIRDAEALFNRIGKDLRQRVSKHVILKYFPRFDFVYDPSLERGAEINDLLDQLDIEND
ncbi:30S ribosome-binding factor RbfA [Coraliomargarita sinensis]|uniref:Ribosome-binding factor A n=1 Tax=Coraliomargarita sinensis TaxID=2174842 RepID=A0A317ZCU6_9BACT|nr:30S ribosome-binding factor RbfA [Coraliomargarita sinensis]PXA02926.1 30S ribosome-binding factor RbfA [Coraliomargarita sinensis]